MHSRSSRWCAIDGHALHLGRSSLQRQELLDGVLPVPSAIWETAAWRLRVQGEATPRAGSFVCAIDSRTASDRSLSVRLLVLVRPFQVTPPWQRVGNDRRREPRPRPGMGGGRVACERDGRHLAGERAFRLRGDEVRRGVRRSASLPNAARGHTSARCARPRLRRVSPSNLSLRAPRNGGAHRGMSARAFLARSRRSTAFDWANELPAAQWSGAGWAMDAIRAALTATAHILVTPLRRGAATRSPRATHAPGFAMAPS